jgi:hypothetical protein
MSKHPSDSPEYRRKYQRDYKDPKNIFGPWVFTKKSPRRYGTVDDWRGDGPFEVQFVDGTVETLDGDALEIVTQRDFEKRTKH